MNNFNSIQIKLSPTFQRRIRDLAKRYRSIREDLEPVLGQLQTGILLGDPIAGFNNSLFKVRVRNHDIQKGKRAGYRLIYYLQTGNTIVLMTIYSKSDQSDVTPAELRKIFDELNL